MYADDIIIHAATGLKIALKERVNETVKKARKIYNIIPRNFKHVTNLVTIYFN